MGTITFKKCDRCGAQFQRDNVQRDHPVQRVIYVIPTSLGLHTVDYQKPTERELCQPCRVQLSDIVRAFMEGK